MDWEYSNERSEQNPWSEETISHYECDELNQQFSLQREV